VFLWELSAPALHAMGLNTPVRDTGIFDFWRSTIGTAKFLGLVVSEELHHKDENGVDAIFQVFSNGIVKWQNGKGTVL
jgi:hypothetical protein